jgi:hypothetical protein
MSSEKDKKVRPRSPEFPYIPLRDAIARVEQLIATYQRHPARIKNLAPLWKYSPGSSSFLRTVAALRSFGLVDETGSGDERKISVSDLGLRVVSDKRPGAYEAAVLKAFETCTILNDYWQKWGAKRPPDSECMSELTLDNGFGEEAAKKFISVYDDTIAFVESLNGDSGNDGGETPPGDEKPVFDVGMYVQWEQSGVLRLERAAKLTGFSADGKFAFVEGATAGIPRAELIPADPPPPPTNNPRQNALPQPSHGLGGQKMIEATYPIAEGTCMLVYPSEMSAKSAKRLKRWLDLMLEDVSELAAMPPATPPGNEDE